MANILINHCTKCHYESVDRDIFAAGYDSSSGNNYNITNNVCNSCKNKARAKEQIALEDAQELDANGPEDKISEIKMLLG